VERETAREQQDADGLPEDPREQRQPPQPFSGSQH
jgi:hypothetical protein